MKPLATLSPSVTEFDILVDMRLVEIDQVMAVPLCLGQQRTELRDKGLPPLGIGAPAASCPSSTTAQGGAGRRGWSHGSRGGQSALVPIRPGGEASSVASDPPRLRVG